MRDPEFLKVHPMGRVPVLEDGDTRIFESGAIVQYVLQSTVKDVWFQAKTRRSLVPTYSGFTTPRA